MPTLIETPLDESNVPHRAIFSVTCTAELLTPSVTNNNSNYKSFDLHSPNDSDVEHLLMCLSTICISSLEECLFEGLPVFPSGYLVVVLDL